ncbi:polyphosphate kinase 2 family protein [Streptomyces sp. NPDC002547]
MHDEAPLRDLLRLPVGKRVDLSAYDTGATPGGPDGKAAGLADTARLGKELAGLQERLWAAATAGDRGRILLVLQGMDTSGKGGTVKHVIGHFNPAGCRIHAFKSPTREERQYDFLWRVAKELPRPGEIGIFDRSHYEDVLIAKVRSLAPVGEIKSRYVRINGFETALTRCATPAAPWHLVPADHKWYRNWAISRLLLECLRELDPQHPAADYDVEECRALLLAEEG